MFKSTGLAKMFAGRMFVTSGLCASACVWRMLDDERECKGIGLRSGKGMRDVTCDKETLLRNTYYIKVSLIPLGIYL